MKLKKKHYPYVIGAGVILLFLATRLYHLLAVPIFTDEAIYIRWTQVFVADVHQLFIPLTDGKQPLFIWLGFPFMKFINNPLLALRLVSVVAGFFTLGGIYLLTKELFGSKKTAVIASLLFVFYPFALVYDKLALYDGLLATFAVWSLYMEVLLVRRRKFYIAALSIGVIGGAMLTKSSAFFFLYLLPASLLLFDFKAKNWKKDLMRWALLAALVSVGALACYSVLRFSPNYHYITDKNHLFVEPFGIWIKHPLLHLRGNLHSLLGVLMIYSTIPVLFLIGLALVIDRRFMREKLLLVIWFAAPFMALVLFGNPLFLFPRYILFMTMPLLVLAAYGVAAITEVVRPRYIAVLAIALLMLPLLQKDYFILTDFSKANIPAQDHYQLIAGYAAGVGVKEAADYLTKQSQNQKIFVGAEGLFGLMPEGLKDYLADNKNIEVTGYWPIGEAPPQAVTDAAQVMPTYFIFYAACPVCEQSGDAPAGWPVKEVFRINKLEKNTSFTLYQVVPSN